jgi:hypothetical protein
VLLVRRPALAAAVLCLAVAGCSDDGAGAEGTPTETPSATVTAGPTDDPSADDAAVEATVENYWRIYVRSQNKLTSSPAMFAGVAEGPLVEQHIAIIRRYEGYGLHRVGSPEISAPQVTVEGDQATSLQCLNEDPWGAVRNGQKQPSPDVGPYPVKFKLEKRAEGWIIVERIGGKDKVPELTC